MYFIQTKDVDRDYSRQVLGTGTSWQLDIAWEGTDKFFSVG